MEHEYQCRRPKKVLKLHRWHIFGIPYVLQGPCREDERLWDGVR